nr:immunoglobulin heavy chain junction region [Macaca mulatta]MOV35921.1 immunoglobulin heavy chain junction region [Macaca mulatta]MOV36001.1 immunoglobulin heavy chain junction region [Macaca mulatta]MOV36049.1 immunoglobulin heavy chain junction region [Macaca mulatta]MOV36409.1 immunoglobulin heavy chain junction region [Macaca mulatta]
CVRDGYGSGFDYW